MGLATSATTNRTMDLGGGPLLSMDATNGCIEVTQGGLWLTMEGEARDTFLAAGDRWHLTGQPVVVSASAAARWRLVGEVAAGQPTWVRGWQRLVRATRRQVQRLQFGPAEGQPWT